MSDVKPIPQGYEGIIPYFSVTNATALLTFLERAFGAEELFRMAGPDGAIQHAEVRFHGAVLMLGQTPTPRAGQIFMYVADVDSAYAKAMTAPGAKSLRAPATQFYGDRSAGLEDAQGNQYWLASRVEDVSPAEMARRAAEQR